MEKDQYCDTLVTQGVTFQIDVSVLFSIDSFVNYLDILIGRYSGMKHFGPSNMPCDKCLIMLLACDKQQCVST